jgi:hypothetical protein
MSGQESFLEKRNAALIKQNRILKSAIKETWSFIRYDLPLTLELEISELPSQTEILYNQADFKQLHKVTLEEAVKLLKTKNEPVHYKVIEELVMLHHGKLLSHWKTPNIGGKVRDLACRGYLKRVGKGMYFYGPKLAKK